MGREGTLRSEPRAEEAQMRMAIRTKTRYMTRGVEQDGGMRAVPGLLCSGKFHPSRPQVDGGQDGQGRMGCCKVYHSPASKGLKTLEMDASLPRLC